MDAIWPDGKRCAASFTFDLDAEYVFLGTNPSVANMPRVLTQGNYVWRSGIVNRILDMLDEYSITSTWYVVAMNAVNHPEEVKEIIDRGHDIATHGWIHEDISKLDRDEEKERRGHQGRNGLYSRW